MPVYCVTRKLGIKQNDQISSVKIQLSHQQIKYFRSNLTFRQLVRYPMVFRVVLSRRHSTTVSLVIKTDSVQSSSNYLQKLFTKNLLTAR